MSCKERLEEMQGSRTYILLLTVVAAMIFLYALFNNWEEWNGGKWRHLSYRESARLGSLYTKVSHTHTHPGTHAGSHYFTKRTREIVFELELVAICYYFTDILVRTYTHSNIHLPRLRPLYFYPFEHTHTKNCRKTKLTAKPTPPHQIAPGLCA